MILPLNETAQIKLNGSGNGTAQIGPAAHGDEWTASVVSVKVSSNTNEAQCLIYLGSTATDDNFADGTFSGSSGDSTDKTASIPFRLGSYVWAVWSGGDANATATLTVTGTRDAR